MTENILLFLHRGHQKLKLQLKTSLKTTTVVHRVPFKADTISSKFREYVEFVGSSQDRRRRQRQDISTSRPSLVGTVGTSFFCFDHNHFPSVSKFLYSILYCSRMKKVKNSSYRQKQLVVESNLVKLCFFFFLKKIYLCTMLSAEAHIHIIKQGGLTKRQIYWSGCRYIQQSSRCDAQ